MSPTAAVDQQQLNQSTLRDLQRNTSSTSMDLDGVIARLNDLIRVKQPKSFNSSWIFRHTPDCYRYIQRNIRSELGGIDWDRITSALERKFQERWIPPQWRKKKALYENQNEVDVVLNKYRNKLFVFISPQNRDDRRMRDLIAIPLVRLSQNGNRLAKQELLELLRFSVEEWVANHTWLSRWFGYDQKIKEQLEGCIRRYRYTGSFLRYVYKTLEYAGRGIRPLYAFSLMSRYLKKGRRESIALDTIPQVARSALVRGALQEE